MKVEVTSQCIRLGGKEYLPDEVKVTIYRRNRREGMFRIIALTIIYAIIVFAAYISPFDELYFDYAYLIYFPLVVSYFVFLFSIISTYYLEYAKIEVCRDREIKLPYSGSSKLIVDKIAIIANSVTWE